MKTFILVAVHLALSGPLSFANDAHDTLKVLLGKSDSVVLGSIVTHPMGIVFSDVSYLCDFRIEKVLKGDAKLKSKTIKVSIERIEFGNQERHPLVKEGSRCILFLGVEDQKTKVRSTADYWFGIQHPSEALEDAIRVSVDQTRPNKSE